VGTARDVGGGDFETTTTIPGPMIRSRHVETEHVDDDVAGRGGAQIDEVACPTCGRRWPGVATRCLDDGTDLRSDEDVAPPT
jgi:hypothetical protein